ncbi:MAG: hypothetical protein WBF42_07715 [Terracidiphilus sp.]
MPKLGSIKRLVPAPARSWLRQRGFTQKGRLLFDHVTDWSVLRRLEPYRPSLGITHGHCIDRFYIEKFLAAHRSVITGDVSEFADNAYTLRFGSGQIRSHVLDIDPANPNATLTLDLACTDAVPSSVFDCILATQVLFEIYDYTAAVHSLFKMLRPGGTALITLPGLCQVIPKNMLGGGHDWWRFTSSSARRLFGDVFGDANVQVASYGNVLSAVAFLHGLVQEELSTAELDFHDPNYELILGISALKPAACDLP